MFVYVGATLHIGTSRLCDLSFFLPSDRLLLVTITCSACSTRLFHAGEDAGGHVGRFVSCSDVMTSAGIEGYVFQRKMMLNDAQSE